MTQTNAPTEALLDLYRRMVRIRRFEDRVYQLFLKGEIPGTVHQCQGQEAVAVGVCAHLYASDWMTSTHRPHGHALAKGVAPGAALAEIYGKTSGCCGGKGGSMHLGDPAVGMIPAVAIVAGGVVLAPGLALAAKLQSRDTVTVCFFGEGATNAGAFHEGLNFAAVQHLPVVFVCENNLYGASTPYHAVSLVPDVAERVRAYGIGARVVDGMDVLAVHAAAGEAVAAARGGAGPTLLECKTYRFGGHSRGDARRYRTDEEERRWRERDPVLRLGDWLVQARGIVRAALQQIDEEVAAEIERAVERARSSAEPRPEQALEGVYA